MEDVVNRRVRTEVMSWKRRELAAPDSRAPLLLRRMACSSPANKLMRITLNALQGTQAHCQGLFMLMLYVGHPNTCQGLFMLMLYVETASLMFAIAQWSFKAPAMTLMSASTAESASLVDVILKLLHGMEFCENNTVV